jgi:hypothetical protein
MRRVASRSALVADGPAKKRVLPGAMDCSHTPRQGKATVLPVGRDRGEDGPQGALARPRKPVQFRSLSHSKPQTCY